MLYELKHKTKNAIHSRSCLNTNLVFTYGTPLTDKWQTRPLVREVAPYGQDCNFQWKINIWSWAPDGARHQDRLTDWLSVAKWLWLWHAVLTKGALVSEPQWYTNYLTWGGRGKDAIIKICNNLDWDVTLCSECIYMHWQPRIISTVKSLIC
jgi:hypothetical protein